MRAFEWARQLFFRWKKKTISPRTYKNNNSFNNNDNNLKGENNNIIIIAAEKYNIKCSRAGRRTTILRKLAIHKANIVLFRLERYAFIDDMRLFSTKVSFTKVSYSSCTGDDVYYY